MTKKYREMNVNFSGILNKCLIASLAIVLVGVILAIVFGINLDINFRGGSRFTYSYTGELKTADAKDIIEETIDQKVSVSESKDLSGETTYLVVTLSSNKALSTEQQTEMLKVLQEKFADNKVELGDANTVNPTIAGSFFAKSIAAVVLAGVLVIVYMGIRFRKIGGVSAGVMVFFALVHDVVVAFLCTAAFRLQIDANFIAVVLTILGYSLNNTIVVYDRVRENRKLYPSISVRENVNKSINQTFSRSVLTTVTTILAVIVILIVSELNGITSLRTFVIPMIFGLISGFYSSAFLAGPLWVRWVEFSEKHKKVGKNR